MSKKPHLEQLSQVPFQIEMNDPERASVSKGTAFVFEHNSETFLITNWHNVSGINPFTRDFLSTMKYRPASCSAKLATIFDDEKYVMFPHNIDLYSKDLQRPLWFEHPSLGSNCDVVAIPISLPGNIVPGAHNAANRIAQQNIPILPGGLVFIVGFPTEMAVGPGWPIWKSGYIASEPEFDVSLGSTATAQNHGGRTIPAIFIDGLPRSGMSGAPIFARFIGGWDEEDPYRPIDITQAIVTGSATSNLPGSQGDQFIGVYGGRAPAKDGEAALGLCWKREAVELICKAKKIGKHPHN